MGRRRARFAVATLALAAALLAATPAASAEHEEGKVNGFDAFVVKGSNGYRIAVIALFRPGYGESSDVVIQAFRKGRRTFYLAPGTVTDKKVEADLGPLGEIDVTFQPAGKTGAVNPSCAPEHEVSYEKGAYVGTIDFRGEEGYTRVKTDRARFLYAFADIGCPYTVLEEVFGADLPGARLRARARFESGGLELQASQGRPGQRVRVEAAIEEKRGRISIGREVTFTASAASFHFAPDLRTAVLDPPAPFSGAGFFRRGAEPTGRWTGDLRVDFPGHSNVSLTGDRFRTSLRHSRLVKETRSPSRPSLSAWPSVEAGADHASSLPPKAQ
jgi:hypothetical protein